MLTSWQLSFPRTLCTKGLLTSKNTPASKKQQKNQSANFWRSQIVLKSENFI